jgi:demethylmenaquinone methyltransferase/2-methoxy-6-polyprenyl-1,4-benzoquinol methylase
MSRLREHGGYKVGEEKGMAINTDLRERIVNLYRKRADNYDFTANLYYLIGYPEWKYRRWTIDRLNLERGDTVLEIGCGTGLNFGLVEDKIGPTGKLIGIDLTDAMLAQAHTRIEREGWDNVELIHQDAAMYEFPSNLDGIYSTFALSLVPEAPEIIRRSAQSLKSAGHWSLLDFQIPGSWPEWLVSAMLFLIKPFTPTEDWITRKPWPEIQTAMGNALRQPVKETYYLGITYLMSGRSKR